jgi:hypothetical protein
MGCVANFGEIVNILEILAGICGEKRSLERLAWEIILSRILKYYVMLRFWFFHVDRDVA